MKRQGSHIKEFNLGWGCGQFEGRSCFSYCFSGCSIMGYISWFWKVTASILLRVLSLASTILSSKNRRTIRKGLFYKPWLQVKEKSKGFGIVGFIFLIIDGIKLFAHLETIKKIKVKKSPVFRFAKFAAVCCLLITLKYILEYRYLTIFSFVLLPKFRRPQQTSTNLFFVCLLN